jgi:tetratricopeptide (TPR) repeat protein
MDKRFRRFLGNPRLTEAAQDAAVAGLLRFLLARPGAVPFVPVMFDWLFVEDHAILTQPRGAGKPVRCIPPWGRRGSSPTSPSSPFGFQVSTPEGLGRVAQAQRDFSAALTYFQESLAISEEIGHRQGLAYGQAALGAVAEAQGKYAEARAHFQESLVIYREINDRRGIVRLLEAFASLGVRQGLLGGPERPARLKRAASLWGAAAVGREELRSVMLPLDREMHDRQVTAVGAELGEEAFEAAWKEGRTMTLDQAIAHALEEEAAGSEG